MKDPLLIPYTEQELNEILAKLKKDRDQCTTQTQADDCDRLIEGYEILLKEAMLLNNSI